MCAITGRHDCTRRLCVWPVPEIHPPRPALRVRGAQLKWYHVAPADQPVTEEIEALARTYLTVEGDADRLTFDGDIGFVVLHRCGESFYFLLVSTWRGSNELWESVYAKRARRLAISACGRVRVAMCPRSAYGNWVRCGTNNRRGFASCNRPVTTPRSPSSWLTNSPDRWVDQDFFHGEWLS